MALILSGTDGLSDVDGSASTPAIRGADTNTGIFFPAADTIAFSEGGTEVMRIDSSGNLGIGTSSPASKLHISGASYNAARIDGSGSGGAWLVMRAGSVTGGIYNTGAILGDTTSGVGIFAETGYDTRFYTNGSATERMRIDTSGNVGIGTSSPGAGIRLDVLGGEIRAGRVDSSSEGGQVSFSRSTDNATAWYLDVFGNTSTPSLRVVDVGAGAVSMAINSSGAVALRGAVSATGVGITFPSTQSASSDANTLDDYEEGTWTPGITFGGGSTGMTYFVRSARYVKIGRMITVGCFITLTAKGSSTGNVQITGLPFPAYTGALGPHYVGVLVGEGGLSGMPTGTYALAWSDSTLYLRYNGTGSFTNLTDTFFTNSGSVYATVTYEIFS